MAGNFVLTWEDVVSRIMDTLDYGCVDGVELAEIYNSLCVNNTIRYVGDCIFELSYEKKAE